MMPQFDADGLLPPGVHWINWDELFDRLGKNPWRQHLTTGLRAALDNLKGAGCQIVYINGSFVTSKEVPNDYDACWEEAGVDPKALDPVLLTFDTGGPHRRPSTWGSCSQRQSSRTLAGLSFLEFFQTDKDTGRPKGIIAIDLGGPRMIKNERQYRITKAQADRFSQTLDSLRQRSGETEGVHPLIAKAQEDALRSQLADLEEELREYESLKAGKFPVDELQCGR